MPLHFCITVDLVCYSPLDLSDKSMTPVILKCVAVRKHIFVAASLDVTWTYSLFKPGLIWCLICVAAEG